MLGRIALLGAVLILPGCSMHSIELAAGPGQETIVRDGLPALISKKKHVVMLSPKARRLKGNARPTFTVAVLNAGDQPVTLREASVNARQVVAGKSTSLRVYRYDELVSEEQTRQAVAAVGAALSGAGRAMSASNAGYVNTTGNINAYSPHGTPYGSATYTARTYDPLRAQLAQQAANAETQREVADLRAQGEKNLALLQGTILKDNTVMPSEWYGGTVVLDPPKHASDQPARYEVVIEFGGEQHTFSVLHVES